MKFSIITPAYNRAFVIERAINSVLDQTYKDWELIVVNDGSTDNTDNVMLKYVSHPQIKYISYVSNKGVNFARNRGIEKCTGDYITFLDSDDEFFVTTLETARKNILRYGDNYDVFAFAVETERGEAKSFLKKNLYSPDYYELLGDAAPGDYLFFLKREIFDKISFEESINAFEVITWLKIAQAYRFLFINEVLLKYWQDTESLIRYKKITPKKLEDMIKGNSEYLKLFDLPGGKTLSIRKEQSKGLSRLGYCYILSGRRKEGLLNSLKSLKVYPLQLRAFRNLLFVLIKRA